MTMHVSVKMSLWVPCQEKTFQERRRLCVWLLAAAFVHRDSMKERAETLRKFLLLNLHL